MLAHPGPLLHAHYQLLKEAGKVADKYKDYFMRSKILSSDQINRMKHIELVCELMISVHQGDVLNKKTVLDKVMQADNFTESQTRRAREGTVRSLNRIRSVFPKIHQTRFCKLSDFYSLAVLMAKFETEGLILSNARSNRLAADLLSAFSVGVDTVRASQKDVKAPPPELEPHCEYLRTVQSGTDEVGQRRKREKILRGLLQSLFEAKDEKRLFSPEQRRILWGATSARKCAKCNGSMTWEDFTVDHISPFSKGGKTALENACLMHRGCNSGKGNR